MTTDPEPWQHTSGIRVPNPGNTAAPIGGYTYSPRHGYSDHPDRYRSTRHHSIGACAECEKDQS